MSLHPGAHLGPFEILSALGAGGMGEVYRARDGMLNRDVAVKVLPDLFASDTDRLARFTREAQTLAALNHPNIAHIHGLEESGGVRALVMELVEGEDLSQRIARGAIPLEDALPIAKQIADALEAAHEQGIIHRDLKPANIKVRPDGMVKVLDFGLAKALDPLSASSAAAVNSPTVTTPAITVRGGILGTPGYMAPEQARGMAVDKRADLWAFGVILWEMLTGRPLFDSATVSDTLASVLKTEPQWNLLPPRTPPSVRRVLRRCLEKDRRRRLASAADARLEIEDAPGAANTDAPPASSGWSNRARIAWASALLLVALIAAAGMVAWATRSAPAPRETTRSLVSVAPSDQSVGVNPLEQRTGSARPTRTAVALSPDGKTLVFGAIWSGEEQLYARALNQLSATPIAGTSGGSSPFFSPDGQWVGFWAAGKLRKVPLAGGPPVPLCDAASIFGASWGADDTIVFASARNGGLWRVSAAGGTPEALTSLQPGEFSHRLPHMLPGGDAVIYTISKAAQRWDDTQIVAQSLATGQRTVLIEGGADGRYAPTGHLLYVRLGTLMAAPFDPDRLVVTGGATGLIDDVMQAANRNLSDMENTLAGQFTLSETGALVYLTGGALPGAERVLAWVNRQGVIQTIAAPPRAYSKPRLSPDGRYISVSTQQDIRDVWRYDIARGALNPITLDGHSGYSLFAPDGKRVVFRSGAGGGEDNLYWKAADGSGAAERLTTSTRSQTPFSWSPDGTTLVFVEEGDSTGFFQFDIWALSIGDRQTRAIVRTPANEMAAEVSPDGRWLAYVSTESGRMDVYVQPYPGPGERHLISSDGGEQPAWRGDSRELFYVQRVQPGKPLMKLMSVSIRTAPEFVAGVPQTIFESTDLVIPWGRSYDVSADGQRFLIALTKEAPTGLVPAQMILVQNWFEELKRVVPGT